LETLEGYYSIKGLKIYYKKVGSGNKRLLTLHGGPGASHDYLSPLAKLGERGITVLFYDQFGCGRSEEPSDLSLFTVDYGVEEVEEVRKAAFGDTKVYLLGHSYGGLLALAYALKYQSNLKGLIISSGLSCVPFAVQEMNRLKSELPADIRLTLDKYESLQDFTNPEYLKAVEHFYKNHLLRLEKTPEDVQKSLDYTTKRKVYGFMNGPNEFTITGVIKDWDQTGNLNKIRVPTLITVGKYDEVTPNVARLIHQNIPNSKLKMFENSSHMAMWEEPKEYLDAVEEFLNLNE
jgi:proline iminopeptidase